MIELKTPAEIERMHVAGRFVAEVLSEVGRLADVGVNLLDLEHHVRGMIKRRGAESCYWDYAPSFGKGPFRNVICLSVNDAVLHGLPRDYTLRDGDVLSADIAVGIDGWVADSARTVVVGAAAEEDLRIIRATEEALEAAIEVARPGNRLGDISAAIWAVARDCGYPVNTEFGGHGIGRTMHEDLHVPNKGRSGRGLKLRPGLTLALEPCSRTTTSSTTPTAGPSGRPTARARPTPSTRSPSPRTPPWCSPDVKRRNPQREVIPPVVYPQRTHSVRGQALGP